MKAKVSYRVQTFRGMGGAGTRSSGSPFETETRHMEIKISPRETFGMLSKRVTAQVKEELKGAGIKPFLDTLMGKPIISEIEL